MIITVFKRTKAQRYFNKDWLNTNIIVAGVVCKKAGAMARLSEDRSSHNQKVEIQIPVQNERLLLELMHFQKDLILSDLRCMNCYTQYNIFNQEY